MTRLLLRTPEEITQAGWDDGAHDAPLTPEEVTRLAALWGPGIREHLRKTADEAA